MKIKSLSRIIGIGAGFFLSASIIQADVITIEPSKDNCGRLKFDNLLNFRGFPHVPGEDWMMRYPSSGSQNDGGRG